MIIDFHVHIFPDEIANKAISTLSQKSNLTPQTDGSVKDTLDKMNLWGIDKAVCLNIATKPTQQRKINSFMKEVSSQRLIPFGTLHPYSESPIDEISFIKNHGIKGIKLHPDYQGFFANDKKVFEIYSTISELQLPLIFHAGYDIGLGCPVHCTPLMIKDVAEAFPNLVIIAAHFGGYGMWYDARTLLSDLKNVYFDTSFPLGLDKKIAEKAISKKGAEKILFASDCPWASPKDVFEYIDSLNITSKDKDLIFSQNAERLLML